MRLPTAVLAAIFALAPVSSRAIAQDNRGLGVETTTFCSLIANPTLYSGKLVRIEARVESDGIHSTLLFSNDRPDQAIAPTVERGFEDAVGWRRINAAIFSVPFGTGGKEISATLVARFISQAEIPTRVLWLRAIADLRITMR